VVKLLNWVSKTILQTLLIAGLTIYLTWIVVHTYVDKIMAKYHLESDQNKVQFFDFLSQMSDSLNILKPASSQKQAADVSPVTDQTQAVGQITDSSSSDKPAVSQPESQPQSSIQPNSSVQSQSKPTPTPSPTTEPLKQTDPSAKATAKAPDDSISAWKQQSGDSKQQTDSSEKQKSLFMSAEQFTQKKDQLSDSDKMKIFTLLASRLPENELQQISAYVEDGVTEQEWAEIQQIVEKDLKPDEYKQLEDLLAKY
jgi:hypothetical protein